MFSFSLIFKHDFFYIHRFWKPKTLISNRGFPPDRESRKPLKPKFQFTSRLNTTQHVRRVERVERVVTSASSSSRRACRAVLFDKLDTAKMHGLDTSNVPCRDVTWRAKWNSGFTFRAPSCTAQTETHRIGDHLHESIGQILPPVEKFAERFANTMLVAGHWIIHDLPRCRLDSFQVCLAWLLLPVQTYTTPPTDQSARNVTTPPSVQTV